MIPKEIIQVLNRGRFNLLIKGAPGTGKTSLALTILRENITTGVYLSTRINLDELQEQFPWVKELIKRNQIYDATVSRFPRKESKYKLQYNNITEFIRSIYDLVESLGGQKVTIVIDSINALKEFFDVPEESMQIEKALIEISDLYAFNTVFISESSTEEKLDYLVDGIIVLERKVIDDSIIRRLSISKLRGSEITTPAYYFTISEEGIDIISPAKPYRDIYTGFRPIKNPDNLYSTGILDLDKILGGGVFKGFSILCEVDSTVPLIYSAYLIDSFGINMMHNNIPWYFMSSLSLSQYYLYNKFKKELKDVDVDKLFRMMVFIQTETEYEEKKVPILKKALRVQSNVDTWREVHNVLKNDIAKNNFETFYVSVALNPLISFYSFNEFLRIILAITKFISAYNGLGVFFTTSKIEGLDQLRGIFDYYFKIEKHGNTVMFRIHKPFLSPYYGVELYENEEGGLGIRLKKVI
ncbi:MAG: ATPase domain-containing protein [Candidatus Asgardarchaeia archaeon]